RKRVVRILFVFFDLDEAFQEHVRQGGHSGLDGFVDGGTSASFDKFFLVLALIDRWLNARLGSGTRTLDANARLYTRAQNIFIRYEPDFRPNFEGERGQDFREFFA